MEELGKLIAAWPTVAMLIAIVFLAFFGWLIIKATTEGREVSFWPPKIGPRPNTVSPIAEPIAQPGKTEEGSQTALDEVTRHSRIASLSLSAQPIAGLLLLAGSAGLVLYVITEAEREVTVGRASHCDIQINDNNLTRQQFRLSVELVEDVGRRSHRFVLTDSGSHNGTWVNGRGGVQFNLHHGDLIQAGASRFLFQQWSPSSL
jgi:hypothetical protein